MASSRASPSSLWLRGHHSSPCAIPRLIPLLKFPRPLKPTQNASRQDFHTSLPRRDSSIFNLGGLSTSRECQYFAKERRMPRTEFSPHLELIRSSEVDPHAAPGSKVDTSREALKAVEMETHGGPESKMTQDQRIGAEEDVDFVNRCVGVAWSKFKRHCDHLKMVESELARSSQDAKKKRTAEVESALNFVVEARLRLDEVCRDLETMKFELESTNKKAGKDSYFKIVVAPTVRGAVIMLGIILACLPGTLKILENKTISKVQSELSRQPDEAGKPQIQNIVKHNENEDAFQINQLSSGQPSDANTNLKPSSRLSGLFWAQPGS